MCSTKINLPLLFLSHLLLLKADSKCPKSFPCTNFSIEFPFTDINNPECGLFSVNCTDTYTYPKLYLGTRDFPYDILQKVSPNKFIIKDSVLENYFSSKSCLSFGNVSLPQSPFVSFTFSPNLTSFTCFEQRKDIEDYFAQFKNKTCDNRTVYYKTPAIDHVPTTDHVPPDCVMNELPIKSAVQEYSGDLLDLLTPNLSLEWHVSEACLKCYREGGQYLATSMNELYCSPNSPAGNTTLKKILLIGGMTIAALTSTLIIIFVFIWRKREKAKQKYEKGIELFLKKNGNLAPLRYKYSSIKKMTNSFTENLGKGGYGSVYKRLFPDGHPVAVKILNESNENGEDFMNEVASISRTSHINIVARLGFCFEGSKRALIYDFMPNGSLEKFIGNNTTSAETESRLGWDKLFEIALGIARGLEYLHQGCNTRILHLDIKPQNILLDKDLNPRISDFGLAKLCPNRSSIVSMMVARGTIGYIAPEVFSRNFGEVSYKSDVYSYGMLVLEMAGGRKNIDPRDVDHTSEIYFPNYIHKQLEMDAERDTNCDLSETMNEDEGLLAKRKLIIVGLWCIQTNPKDRPSMTKVVEMMEGKHGSLEVPPKPHLYSLPRSPPTISVSESS